MRQKRSSAEAARQKIPRKKTLYKKKVDRNLPVDLTEKEFSSYGKECATHFAEISKLKMDLEAIKMDYKKRIGCEQKQVSEITHVLNNGYVHRRIECEATYDWKNGTKTITRLDTGEEVGVENIGVDERQTVIVSEERDE